MTNKDKSAATKANLPLKVCLKVANAVNAQIVLDEPAMTAGHLVSVNLHRSDVEREANLVHSARGVEDAVAPPPPRAAL